jgi:hypothetical protein
VWRLLLSFPSKLTNVAVTKWDKIFQNSQCGCYKILEPNLYLYLYIPNNKIRKGSIVWFFPRFDVFRCMGHGPILEIPVEITIEKMIRSIFSVCHPLSFPEIF